MPKTKPVNQTIDITEKVMGKIKKENISIRSKYLILAEKIGWGGVVGFSFLVAVFIVNLLLYTLTITDLFDLFSFGRTGLVSFLELFPYHLVFLALAVIVVSGLLIRTYDFSYKKPFFIVGFVLLALVLTGGTVLAFSGINTKLEETSVFRPMYGIRGRGMNPNHVWGEVTQVNPNSFVIRKRSGLTVKVVYSGQLPVSVGETVFVTGTYDDRREVFTSERIEKSTMPSPKGPGQGRGTMPGRGFNRLQ